MTKSEEKSTGNDDIEEWFWEMALRLDPPQGRAAVSRSVRGRDRAPLADKLQELAITLPYGSKERIYALKWAHCICPLHGPPARELASLLLRRDTLTIEWVDLLITVIAEEGRPPTILTAQALAKLGELLDQSNVVADRLRKRVIVNAIRNMELKPSWIDNI